MQAIKKRKYQKYESETTRRIKLVRRIIKKKCPTVSVRMGAGTSWGHVDVMSKDIGASFTKKEINCLKGLGLIPGGNFAGLDRERQKEFVEYHMMKRAGIKKTGE